MTCIGKTKHTSLRGLLIQYKFGSELTVQLRTYQITFQECSKLESNVEILPFSVLNAYCCILFQIYCGKDTHTCSLHLNSRWNSWILKTFDFNVAVCFFFFQQNSSFVDWSPIVNEEEEFELESSDYSEWDLVTQSKSKEEGDSRVLSLFASMTLSKFCAKCHIAAKEIVCFQSFLMPHFKLLPWQLTC